MNLPPIHNKRSPEQWEIISKHVDFKGKTVLDLGCGYGDILFRCWQAGASCSAIDSTLDVQMIKRLRGFSLKNSNFYFNESEIESLIQIWNPEIKFNVIICFSVLLYLENRLDVLKWIKDHSEIALLEMQYFGDGPGLASMENDDDARAMLKYIGWQSVEPIGKTLVEDRQKYRTIWLCQNG